MAAMKKDFGLIVWVFGWLLNIATSIRKIAADLKMPFGAFERLGNEEGEATLAKALKVIREDWVREETRNCVIGTVVVPDLSPEEQVALVKEKTGAERCNLSIWDFTKPRTAGNQLPIDLSRRPGHEKRYEVLAWLPPGSIGKKEVREHFSALGADGNTSALLAWIAENPLSPDSLYLSVPNDDVLLCDYCNKGALAVAGFRNSRALGGSLELVFFNGFDSEKLRHVYLAFREIL